MTYCRNYDVSFIKEERDRLYIQHAVEGVNKACSDTLDAWLYVQQGVLQGVTGRTLNDSDFIAKIVLDEMLKDSHSGYSATWTLSALYEMSVSYEQWRNSLEEIYALQNEREIFWDAWRLQTLVPFYNSKSNNLGPILDDYLSKKVSREDCCLKLDKEMDGLLGADDLQKLSSLNLILEKMPTKHLIAYRNRIKRMIDSKAHGEEYTANLVQQGIQRIYAAVEARNVDALEAALNPGFNSFEFNNSEQYKNARELLKILRGY